MIRKFLTLSFCLCVSFAAVVVGGLCAHAQSTDRDQILAAYRSADKAYEALDANALFDNVLPTWYSIDDKGKRVSRAEAYNSMVVNFKRPPNEKVFFWRCITDVTSLTISGDKASGHSTAHCEQVMENTFGVIANGSVVTVGIDEWVRTPKGWKNSVNHVLSQKTNVSAHVSPYVLEQLQQMRVMNDQLRNFNYGINYSNCMYSQGMQTLEYFERQQRCLQ